MEYKKEKKEENLKLIYNQEYWFVSAFINTNQKILKINEESEEIRKIIETKLKNLDERLEPEGDMPKYLKDYKDDERKELKTNIIDLGKNISIKCEWVSHIPHFHYFEENIESEFNELGSFQFAVEYYETTPERKETIDPKYLQQIAYIAKKELEKYNHSRSNVYIDEESKKEKRKILIDYDSPIYTCIISNKIKTNENKIEWNRENIEKYKKIIGKWTEIYSGSWPDYSEELYESRVEDNLSNRKSELHYLRRNSGFIYMPDKNFEKCDTYLIENLLSPTAKIRAILFALLHISESINILSDTQQEDSVKRREKSLKARVKKLDKIRRVRLNIQEHMGHIINELDYNRRYHHTMVIKFLMNQFQIEKTYERISKQFDVIYDSIENESLRHQLKQERSLQYLNILIVAGIIAQVLQFFISAFREESKSLIYLNMFGIALLLVFLILVILVLISSREKLVEKPKTRTVDVIIQIKDPSEPKAEKILIIKRKNTPYRDCYALPGCFYEKDVLPERAIKARVKLETNLDIDDLELEKVASELKHSKKSIITSEAYKCVYVGKIDDKCGKNVSEIKFFPVEKIENLNLSFHHRKILERAGFIGNKNT